MTTSQRFECLLWLFVGIAFLTSSIWSIHANDRKGTFWRAGLSAFFLQLYLERFFSILLSSPR